MIFWDNWVILFYKKEDDEYVDLGYLKLSWQIKKRAFILTYYFDEYNEPGFEFIFSLFLKM